MTYHVPAAARVDGDRMTYDLDIDPQGTVVPQSVVVNVHLPAGYHVSGSSEGWSTNGRTVTYTNDALDDSPHLAISMSRT